MKTYLIFISLFIIMSCKNLNSKNKDTGKIINYYHGIVLNEDDEPLSNVDVTLLDSNKIKVATNNKGYFQIRNKNFNHINIQKDKNIIFNKQGYIIDTISTVPNPPDYLPHIKKFNSFIYEIPDTVRLRKEIKF